MELPSRLIEQNAFNTRPKIEEHMLVVMDKRTHEEHLYQPLQTTIQEFKFAVTFLNAYNGIFNVTCSKNNFYSLKLVSDEDGYIILSIRPGVYERGALKDEIKGNIIDEGLYTELDYTFYIKPDLSTLGSIIEISSQGPVITFVRDDSIGELLGFNKTTIYGEYNLSPNPVDIISFDNTFLEGDIARGMIFRGKRSGIIHNCTKDVNPGYKYNKKIRCGVL